MNDKQQLAAMGEHMAEQPMCMAKRIEELEAHVRVMAGLLREAQECVVHDVVRGMGRDVESLWARIDAALAGKLPAPAVQEGWQLVPVEPTNDMLNAGYFTNNEANKSIYSSMLAAAPKPEPKP